jgi:hypothetical protein
MDTLETYHIPSPHPEPLTAMAGRHRGTSRDTTARMKWGSKPNLHLRPPQLAEEERGATTMNSIEREASQR